MRQFFKFKSLLSPIIRTEEPFVVRSSVVKPLAICTDDGVKSATNYHPKAIVYSFFSTFFNPCFSPVKSFFGTRRNSSFNFELNVNEIVFLKRFLFQFFCLQIVVCYECREPEVRNALDITGRHSSHTHTYTLDVCIYSFIAATPDQSFATRMDSAFDYIKREIDSA